MGRSKSSRLHAKETEEMVKQINVLFEHQRNPFAIQKQLQILEDSEYDEGHGRGAIHGVIPYIAPLTSFFTNKIRMTKHQKLNVSLLIPCKIVNVKM